MPAATAEPKAPETKAPITSAEAEAVTKDIYSRLRVKPTPPKAKAKEEKPAEEKKVEAATSEKPAETAPAKPAAATTAKKKATAPEQTRVTLDAVALGETIVKGLAPSLKQPEAAKVDEPKLSPANEKKLSVLKRMAKNNPANASKPDEFIAALKKSEAYQKQWEADNKGKKFNPADEEHAEFQQNNDVSWDEDEYLEALADMKVDAATQPLKDQQESQKKEAEAQERVRKTEPLAIAHQATCARILFDELGEEFKTVLDENGNLNKAEIEKLRTSKPEISKFAFTTAQQIEAVTGSMYRMANGTAKFDDKNATHIEALNFVEKAEADMKAKPDSEQEQDGKVFATGEEYAAMTPEQRKNHWRFDVEELSALYAIQKAGEVKELAEKYEKEIEAFAVARGYTKPAATNGSANGTAPIEEAKPTPRSPSPAGTIEPRMTTAPKSEGGSAPTIFDRLKGKK